MGGEGQERTVLNEKGLKAVNKREILCFEKGWEMLVMKLNDVTDRFSCTRRPKSRALNFINILPRGLLTKFGDGSEDVEE